MGGGGPRKVSRDVDIAPNREPLAEGAEPPKALRIVNMGGHTVGSVQGQECSE